MRIKSISMRGFKSFMDKASFHIPPGISAFVGPNGCGKSNVVDAIRWVMGEQSPKQLRGRQMEDMIFSGNGSLKPLGMAEVTLTLEDTEELNGASEISVTRRLYRSNESDYLINNSPCRLRDIQDLFMGTGLGNRSYSIIAQGEIGSIIEQKPEETRRLLEEAAGITKYKARREESLRKISLTQENLSRVQDLLGEIKRGMNSLKRQAYKARRFKEASSEIHRLELVLDAYTYAELTSEKGKRKRVIDDLTERAQLLEARLAESEERIETTNTELIEEERYFSGLKESVFSLREEGRKHEDALNHLSAEQERLRTGELKLGTEKEEIGQKLREFQSEIEGINSRVAELQEWIQDVSGLRAQHESVFRDKRLTLERLKEELKTGESHIIELASEESRCRGEMRNLSETVNQLGARKDALEGESKEIAKRLDALSDVLNKKQEKREEAAASLGCVENDFQEAHARRGELEERKKAKEFERLTAESELSLSRSQLSTIESLIEGYEGYQSGVRAIMSSPELKTNREDKILGVVADFIQVDPEFEIAVEAVLAERLQYVIVSRQEDGKEAVEYLRAKERGRSYFLPLKDFRTEKPLGRFEVNLNGYRLLSEHVTAPERFSPLIRSFLGNAAMVENLSEALSVWRKDRGQQTLVTPEGDLVDKRGVISGGRLGKESSGLLARRRKQKELQGRIRETERSIAALHKVVEELDLQLKREAGLIERLDHERQSHLHDIEGIDKDLFLIEKESEQLMKQSQYLLHELESLCTDKDQKSSQISDIEEKLSECQREKEDIQQSVAEKGSQVEALEQALEDSKESLSELAVRYNRHKEEEKGLVRERERIEQFTEEMEARVQKIEREITATQEGLVNCLSKQEEIRNILAATCEKQKGLEKEHAELEQQCGILKARLQEEEKKSALVREEIGAIRDQINDARIREAEVDFQINSILSQASKDTGINLQRDYREYLDDDFSRDHYESRLQDYKAIKERIGDVNLLAIGEYEELKERYDFITAQQQDLLASIDSLNKAIRRINRISKRKFLHTLGKVDEQLKRVFPILFNGGSARLRLVDEDLPLESGVVVEVQPPGKRVVHMGLLSGGEKALAAMALLFAVYLIKPSPFIIMDEVDAPLDEANTDRFNRLLLEIEKSSQVIMVTHNRKTMEVAERLYGMVMDKSSVSKVVSVDLKDYQQDAQEMKRVSESSGLRYER
jgi:chromosome segregation protein